MLHWKEVGSIISILFCARVIAQTNAPSLRSGWMWKLLVSDRRAPQWHRQLIYVLWRRQGFAVVASELAWASCRGDVWRISFQGRIDRNRADLARREQSGANLGVNRSWCHSCVFALCRAKVITQPTLIGTIQSAGRRVATLDQHLLRSPPGQDVRSLERLKGPFRDGSLHNVAVSIAELRNLPPLYFAQHRCTFNGVIRDGGGGGSH